jgi:hypothetical protein
MRNKAEETNIRQIMAQHDLPSNILIITLNANGLATLIKR